MLPRILIALILCALCTSTVAQVVPSMQIDRDVTVSEIVSDVFTWRDSANKPRSAALGHNDSSMIVPWPAPNGTTVYGGALREFKYQLPDGSTRTLTVTGYQYAGYGGFGYVVSHSNAGNCVGDDSPLGFYFPGQWERIFEGRHHAIFRFTQNYPRSCPDVQRAMPVTIDWIFSTGRDNPVYAITYDVDQAKDNAQNPLGADVLMDDSRAPYGELVIDPGYNNIDGVAWGDRYKFTSTSSPVHLNSTWTWTQPNTVPFVKLWVNGPLVGGNRDATMGIVQTQTMSQQDAGGGRNPYYHDMRADFWGRTNLTAPAGRPYLMPWADEWPYQANANSIGPDIPNSNARMTWKTQFGFLGSTNYTVNDGVVDTAPGYPKKSYSTFIVIGTHTSAPVEAQVAQIETIQSLTMTAAIGSVVTSGPAGVARGTDLGDLPVTFSPAGYNHVYSALAFRASGNRIDATVAVGAGTLSKPLIIVSAFAGLPQSVKLNGATLIADVDYFASPRASENELWITLNQNLSGASNRIEIAGLTSGGLTPAAGFVARGDFDGDGRSDILLRDTAGNLGLWIMNGATITGGFFVGSPGGSYTVAGIGDFNGDTKADILLRDAGGNLGLWIMNGATITGGFFIGSPGGSYTVAGINDFNGDARADILLRDSSGTLGMWLMNGATITSGALVGSPGGSYTVAGVGDFNNNGKADILLRDTLGNLGMWLMDGAAITSGAFVGSPGGSYSVAGVGDFNADSKADILLRDSGGTIGLWLMNGAVINSGALVGSPGAYTVAAAKDYSGDGKADILLRDSSGQLGMWIMNGSSITSGALVGSPGPAYSAF